jgi:hypothetical protein
MDDRRLVQKPLKEQYRNDPAASRITLKAKGGQTETPVACSVAVGRSVYQAQAHPGVRGAGTAACLRLRSLQLAKGGRKQAGQRVFAWAGE